MIDAHVHLEKGPYTRDMADIIDGIDTGRQQRVETCKGLLQSGKK